MIALLMAMTAARADALPMTKALENPASLYCIKKGGQLAIRKDAKGNESGWCTLPDGRVIEEWALFRQDHPAPK